MNIKVIRGSFSYNNKKYDFNFQLLGCEVKYTVDNLEIRLNNDKNLINVSVFNKSEKVFV